MPSGWDLRIGAGYADLGAGDTVGEEADIYGVDDAKMLNLDANAGYQLELGGGNVRPFLGIRYLEWDQDQDFHPSVPAGCCSMDSEFWGIGPQVGFDATFGLTERLSLVAGADAAVLFGDIDFEWGTNPAEPSDGSDSRTVFNAGAYAGLEFAVTETMSFGARYRLMYLDGSSYDTQAFDDNINTPPSGKASNLLHGPSASLTVKF
jgi:opacity protein-like surface antigen